MAGRLGYEWDEDLDNGFRPPGTFDLSSTTVSVPQLLQDQGNTYASGTAIHSLTLYRASSGALVFDAGTVQWAWGLDVNHDTAPDTGQTSPSPDMQQAMVNLLADMGAQPATIQAGLVAATASTDTAAPTSTITAPAGGSTVTSGGTVTVTGTASDTGGGVVAGVEVSLDGGATWHPASGTTSWSYAWHPARAGTATIRSRATDDSGNLESPSAGVAVSVSGSPAVVSVSTVQNGTSAARPAGVLAGDLLIASLEVDANPVSVTGPGGWTLLLDTSVAPGTSVQNHAQVWYKVATASEPASYSWGVPAGVYTDIAVLDYMNVSQTAPIDVSGGRDAGVTRTPTTPSLTTTVPGDMLIAFFQGADFGNWTAGSSMTQRYSFDSITAQDALQTAAGATGTKTATNTTSTEMAAQIVALRPLPTDTQPPSVSVTAPANGSTVSGAAVTLTASASDNVAVASVQFLVDGSALGGALTSAPYTTSWDSTKVANGSHSITARATDTSGNAAASTPVTVTVSNAPPPAISNVAASGITTSAATIGWTTDVAASSQVDYGTTASYGSSTALDATPVTSHSQALAGLSPATTYHYRVKSADSSGSLAVSGDFTFVTATPPPPVISNVQAGSVSSGGATITWTTDAASDTTVQYGTTTSYGSSASTPGLVTSHSQALGGLTSSTTYHYRVQSKDAYGQVSSSGDLTFTTAVASTPPSFRSQSSVTDGTTVAKPSGAAAGDLLLATLEVDADPVTVTGPSGWTLLLDTPAAQGTASAFHAQVWYKAATASEPGSYTWTVSGNPWVDIGLLDYSGVNTTSPVDVASGKDAGVTTAPTTNSVTTTAANEMVVALFVDFNAASWTAGTGTTKRYDFDGNTAEDAVQAGAGATGARSATASVSGPVTAQIVALRGR